MKSKQKLKKMWRNVRLPLLFTILFTIMEVLAFVSTVALFHVVQVAGIHLQGHGKEMSIAVFVAINLISGTLLAFLAMRIFLRPVNKYIDAIDRIAEGDYTVSINIEKLPIYRRFSEHFNKMVAELNSIEMLSNDFIHNFSHEFKTPINSIKGFASMLDRKDVSDEEKREYLDIIIKESGRLADLSTEVLNLSKIEQQTILTGIINVNISEQIRIAISMIDNKWKDKRINFNLITDDDVYIKGNGPMLEQIWLNLMDNAVKFSPDGGTVDVSCEQHGAYSVIRFTNDCAAISDETLAHIFDKFYQGDTSHKVKGNGLGLAITKKIIELHGGYITVKYNDGKIHFIINLPNHT